MEFAGSPFEIKSLSDAGQIEGLLAGFGNVDSHGDRILHGAFTKTLAERGNRPLPMLLHHDMHRPIGAWKSWEERREGLYVKGALTLSVADAQEAHALARDGALTGLSIGYRAKRERLDRAGLANELVEIELFEGSLVTVPSNPSTHVTTVKSVGGARDIEHLLREAGISGRKAKAAASAAWAAIQQSKDETDAHAELASLFAASSKRLGITKGL